MFVQLASKAWFWSNQSENSTTHLQLLTGHRIPAAVTLLNTFPFDHRPALIAGLQDSELVCQPGYRRVHGTDPGFICRFRTCTIIPDQRAPANMGETE